MTKRSKHARPPKRARGARPARTRRAAARATQRSARKDTTVTTPEERLNATIQVSSAIGGLVLDLVRQYHRTHDGQLPTDETMHALLRQHLQEGRADITEWFASRNLPLPDHGPIPPAPVAEPLPPLPKVETPRPLNPVPPEPPSQS